MKRKPPPNAALAAERFAQQMARSTLAAKSGVSEKTIWEKERKGGFVRMDSAKRIAKALGKDVSDLFDEDAVIG